MISAKELLEVEFAVTQSGYSTQEVDFVVEKVVETLQSYEKQSDELYHKMEVLATKVEEYRQEENAIKSALVSAEKLAESIKKQASDESKKLVDESSATATATVDEAKEKANKIVSEANAYAKNIIEQKDNEAKEIITNAQTKANEAINSAKIVAADIMDQAKAISDDLISKSKAEKEAYEILIGAIKSDAKEFIAKAKELYTAQLDILNSANLEVKSDETQVADDKISEINDDVESLVDEIEEVTEALPVVEEVVAEEEPVAEEEAAQEDVIEEVTIEDVIEESLPAIDEEDTEVIGDFTPIFDDDDEDFEEITEDEAEEEIAIDDEPIDPMAAVAAFSTNEITPIDSNTSIFEIDEEAPLEEASLFDTEEKADFENYFTVNSKDVHGDMSETISLVPPEDDDDEDDAPHFKGFFKKKK